MKLQKIATAGLAVAAFLSIAACSDGGSDDATPSTSAVASSSTSTGSGVSDPSKPPTASTLNGLLEKALDANVPAADKTDLVQGSQADPQLFDKLVKFKQDNPTVSYQLVPPVIATGSGQASVKVKVKLPDNPEATLDAAIVYDQGNWKLAKSTVCLLLQSANVKSAMCAA
ncbi:hypothetical protein [Williamsia sp.]|uniref:hypothetical protein n=1 Tax=Williamsia sp. TaxID=1872085 RepID=UPI001A306682|nr:hypothetical protein [Williamsia sp.]MBJ7291527.1 hypothetical protein [Williamsia sp.]